MVPESRQWLEGRHLTWGPGSPGTEPRTEGGGGDLEQV